MGWEAPVWSLYCRLSTQWRQSFGGRTGLDYNVAVPLIDGRGWRLERALDLLRTIEKTYLDWDASEREQPGRH